MEPLINEMLLPPTLRGLVEEVREQLASLQLVVAPPVLNIITAAVRVTSCVYIFSQKVGNNVGHQILQPGQRKMASGSRFHAQVPV